MAITDPAGFRSALADSSAMTRNVAGDMAAIFGAGVRTLAAAPPSRGMAIAPARRSRWPVGVGAAALVAVTVAVGISAGKIATADPAATPGARVVSRGQPPAFGAERGQVTELATTAATPSLAPSEAPVAMASPTPIPQTIAEPENPPAPVETTAPPAPVAQVTTVAAPVSAPAAPILAVAPAPPDLRRTGCEDDNPACLAARIERADQRLDETFVRAAAAGVRKQELGDFLREWDRARAQARRQPQAALGRYALITADLRDLTAVAAARNGAVKR